MKPLPIIEWTQQEGEVRALDRLRVLVLPILLKEGVIGLASVNAETNVSDQCYQALKEAAADIVGRTCPV